MARSGLWLLDGIDIAEAYGAFIEKGSYISLLTPPRRKPSLTNNWREHNGEEVDLSTARYEAKDVDIVFVFAGSPAQCMANYDAFIAAVMANGQRQLTINSLGKTFEIYYKETNSVHRYMGIGKMALRISIKFRMN